MSDAGLRGGTVLVTGASRGLGREVALRLAARGFTVIAGMRAPAPVAGLETLVLDVANEASIRAVAASFPRPPRGRRPIASPRRPSTPSRSSWPRP